jgi:hypothetical protein
VWPLKVLDLLSDVRVSFRSRGGADSVNVKMGPAADPTKTDLSPASVATAERPAEKVTSRRRSPDARLWTLQV